MLAQPAETVKTSDNWIWVVEDEENCRFVYEDVLTPHYQLRQFSTIAGFEEAIQHAPVVKPHLIIADLRLPDGFFLDTVSKHKQKFPAPFMVISSVQDSEILRDCFQFGAHDFMTKPFSSNELLVKVERLLAGMTEPTHKLTIDAKNLRATNGSESTTKLTRRELQILQLLDKAPDKQVLRTKMIQSIWGHEPVTSKNLDVHLVHLRRKLKCIGYEITLVAIGTYRLLASAE